MRSAGYAVTELQCLVLTRVINRSCRRGSVSPGRQGARAARKSPPPAAGLSTQTIMTDKRLFSDLTGTHEHEEKLRAESMALNMQELQEPLSAIHTRTGNAVPLSFHT